MAMERSDFESDKDWEEFLWDTGQFEKLYGIREVPLRGHRSPWERVRDQQEEALQVNREPGNGREPVSHYETQGGIECIDFLRSLGIAYEFSRGNAIKYLTRAGRKDGNSALGDLKKARTYIDFMIEELDV